MKFDFTFLTLDTISRYVLHGFYFSLQLTLIATVGGILIGTALALMRLSGKKWLAVPSAIYVDTFRSIPLVMVILGFFLLIPAEFYAFVGGEFGSKYRVELSAVVTFTFFEAAYFSEIMRAGIQSVPKGQVFAGYAVGMTYSQCMKLIVLPQAFRNMLPVLLTQTIILFQDTSLVYAIGAYDLLKGFMVLGNQYNRPMEVIVVAAVIYLVICFSLSMLVRKLQKKIQIIR